uniref:Uncharacterized protein n=1 Tax=Panagrolaimus sp. PS1159 TaxID=55785 RepID=A0AC35EY39_9BILA
MLRRHNSSAGHNSTAPTVVQNHINSGTGITPARRNSTVDSSGRFCALPTENGLPEVLITLCYLDQSQKAVVTIEKASNLCHDCTDKVSETYIRTSIPRNELENTSVLIQVFRNIGMLRRRQQIGFVCIGENASSPDAQDHWNQMIQGLGTSVEKWHYLRRPDHEKINGVNK